MNPWFEGNDATVEPIADPQPSTEPALPSWQSEPIAPVEGPTDTSETTPTTRTGFADFRRESRYARSRVTLTGSFDAAIGTEFQATPGGAT